MHRFANVVRERVADYPTGPRRAVQVNEHVLTLVQLFRFVGPTKRRKSSVAQQCSNFLCKRSATRVVIADVQVKAGFRDCSPLPCNALPWRTSGSSQTEGSSLGSSPFTFTSESPAPPAKPFRFSCRWRYCVGHASRERSVGGPSCLCFTASDEHAGPAASVCRDPPCA